MRQFDRFLQRRLDRQFQRDVAGAAAAAAVPTGFSRSRTSLRVDASSSTHRFRGAFVKAVSTIQEAIGQNPDNRVARSVFDRSLTDLDVDPAAPDQLIFRKVAELPDFDTLYPHDGWGSHIDEAAEKELSRLLRRFRGADSGVRELSIFITDGLIVPGYCGPDRQAYIRQMVRSVLTIADQFGGVEKSPIAMFYCGIGYTREEHHEVAIERYGLPYQWFMWRPDRPASILGAGEQLAHSVSNFDRGVTGTIFVDDKPDFARGRDHQGTIFVDDKPND